MNIYDLGADLRPHNCVVRIIVELHDATRQRPGRALHASLERRGRQHLMEIRLRIGHRLPAHGVAAHVLEQFLGVWQVIDAPPHFRQRHRRGLDHRRLARNLVLGLVIDAELPRHHQLLVIMGDLIRSLDLHPLLEQASTVFQRLKHAQGEHVIGIAALPRAGQDFSDDRGALQEVLRVSALEIYGKFKLDRAEQMRRGAVEMRCQHIDQRLGAIVASGLGDGVHQPAIRRPHPDADAAHLDIFVGKGQ